MRLSWLRSGLVGLMLAVLGAAGAIAPAQELPQDTLVDVVLKDADLRTATQMLTQRTGLQFVIEPSAEPYAKITLDLKRQPASFVIAYICKAAGASFKQDENGVYLIGRFQPESSKGDGGESKVAKVTVFRKIRLQKADSRDVYMSITNINPYDPTWMFKQLNQFQDLSSGLKHTPLISELSRSLSPESYSPLPTRSFQAPRTGAESGNDIRLPGEAAMQVGAGGGGDGGFGGQGGQGGFGGQGGGGGGGGGGQVPGAGQGFMPPGIDLISYDPTDNSLVIQGTEDAINALQRIIAEFDRAPKQVEVKVEFVTTSSTVARAIGYDIRYQRGTVLFGSQFAPSNTPFFLSYATGNAAFRLGQIFSESRGKGVQAPTIRTMNNQPASITSQTTITLFVNRVITTPNGNITLTDAQQFAVTTGLAVTPRINNDGTITMFLAPQVSEIGQIRRDPQGNEFPDISRQNISVVARVKNGETIALGGFNRKNNQETGGRYPILSELPIIGQFFRSKNVTRNDVELMIFVTPTIVEDDETIGAANP